MLNQEIKNIHSLTSKFHTTHRDKAKLLAYHTIISFIFYFYLLFFLSYFFIFILTFYCSYLLLFLPSTLIPVTIWYTCQQVNKVIVKAFSEGLKHLKCCIPIFVKMLVPWRQVLVQVVEYESQQREKKLVILYFFQSYWASRVVTEK